MNYRIYTNNYIECQILPTDEEIDGVDVFKSFGKAKEAYLKNLRSHRDAWSFEIKYGLKKTKKETDKLA